MNSSSHWKPHLICCLRHLEDKTGLSEPQVLRWDVAIKENVDSYSQLNMIEQETS